MFLFRNLKLLIAVLMVSLSISPFFAHVAHAATFTVNSLLDASDATPGDGSCDDGAGHCTLRAAIEEANALAGADTITISVTGTTNPATAYDPLSDTAGATVSGPGSGQFIIDSDNISTLYTFSIVSSNNSFSGFSIINEKGEGFELLNANQNTFDSIVITGKDNTNGASLMEFTGSSHNTLVNMQFSHGALGMRFEYNSDYNSVTNSSSRNNTHSGMTIYDSAYNTLTHNTIDSSANFGMYIIFGSDHNTIQNNTITNCSEDGASFGELGADNGTVNNNLFENNTISGSGWNGLSLSNDSDHNIVSNNIITNSQRSGILLNNTSDDTISGNTIADSVSTGISIVSTVSRVVIGGSNPADKNSITGSGSIGILIGGTSFDTISIIGNYIGLDMSGAVVPGLQEGIILSADIGSTSDFSTITIGGSNAGEGNVIAGSSDIGIGISGMGVHVFGNKIGTNTAGVITSGYGNVTGVGVIADNGGTSNNNQIGGDLLGQGNIIAGNSTAGVAIIGIAGLPTPYPERNAILGNSIYGNNGNGIDLVEDGNNPVFGHTPNDLGDTDIGPNDYLNYPVITTVDTTTNNVGYTVDVPAGNYHVEFFKNPTNGLSVSGYGEGELFVGSQDFTSPGGIVTKIKTLTGITAGDVVTATITEDLGGGNYGPTSEFSNSVATSASAVISNGGGNSGGFTISGGVTGGRLYADTRPLVITENTSVVSSKTCPYFTSYLKRGEKNNPVQVTRWQKFLNEFTGSSLKITGVYDTATFNQVKAFQMMFKDEILTPWGLTRPTGYTYKTTRMKASQLIGCSESPVVVHGKKIMLSVFKNK